MRGPLRILIAGIVIVVIGGDLILETPGTIESVGLVLVLVAMLIVIVQERRKPS